MGTKVSRPLLLKDGTELRTLSDARAVLIERFSTVTHDDALAHAGQLLLRAAETGKRSDIAEADGSTRSRETGNGGIQLEEGERVIVRSGTANALGFYAYGLTASLAPLVNGSFGE